MNFSTAIISFTLSNGKKDFCNSLVIWHDIVRGITNSVGLSYDSKFSKGGFHLRNFNKLWRSSY